MKLKPEKVIACRISGLYFLISSIVAIVSMSYSIVASKWVLKIQPQSPLLLIPNVIVLITSVILLIFSRDTKQSIVENIGQNNREEVKSTVNHFDYLTLVKLTLGILLIIDSFIHMANTTNSWIVSYITMKTRFSKVPSLGYDILRVAVKTAIANIPVYVLFIIEFIIGCRFITKKPKNKQNEMDKITSE